MFLKQISQPGKAELLYTGRPAVFFTLGGGETDLTSYFYYWYQILLLLQYYWIMKASYYLSLEPHHTGSYWHRQYKMRPIQKDKTQERPREKFPYYTVDIIQCTVYMQGIFQILDMIFYPCPYVNLWNDQFRNTEVAEQFRLMLMLKHEHLNPSHHSHRWK